MATDAPLAPAASRLDVRALLQAQAASSTRPSVVVDKEDDLQYDLGHLCAFDPSPVDAEALREDREGHLLRTARDNMQLLANQLYGLLAGAQEKSVIRLPPPVTQLPREKPLPEARQLTRWEKFAKEKGIVKHKRSKMVWDEVSGPTAGPRCACAVGIRRSSRHPALAGEASLGAAVRFRACEQPEGQDAGAPR